MGARARDLIVRRLSPYDKLRAFDTGLTPELVLSKVASASYSATAQTRLFETMESRDTDVGNAIDQRCLALSGARWRIEPREGVDESRVKRITAAIPDEVFTQQALEHAAKFRLFGYALLEIEWERDWTVKALHPVPYSATMIETGEISIVVGTQWTKITDPSLASRLIVLRADDNDPAGAARMRRIVGMWTIKSFLARDWAAYLERFADPLLHGTVPSGAPNTPSGTTAKDALLNALVELRHAGIIVTEGEAEIELLADSRTAATAAFDTLWDRCNTAIYNGILGQQSTTKQGPDGARASDEVRSETLDSLVEADGKIIAATIDRDLVRVVERYHAGGALLARTAFSWEKEQPIGERVDVYTKAKAAGIPFSIAAAQQELGLTPPTPEEERAAAEKSAAVAELFKGAKGDEDADDEGDEEQDSALSRLWGRLVAAFRRAPGTQRDALESLTQEGADELTAALHKQVSAIRRLVGPDMTVAEAEAALGRMLTAETAAPIADSLFRAILAATYNGRADARAWIAKLEKRQES